MRALLFAALWMTGCAATPCPAAEPAPLPGPAPSAGAAPSAGSLEAALDAPVALDVRVHDYIGHGSKCGASSDTVVLVDLDDKPWCKTTIPCTTEMVAPPPSFGCTGAPVAAGEHVMTVRIDGKPSRTMIRKLSLPAFAKMGKSWTFGAHVSITVGDDTVIDPPTARESLGM